MKCDLCRGFRRLWLFFSLVWVIVLGLQVIDARAQIKKATELGAYYTRASFDVRRLEGRSGFSSIVSDHLSEQVESNAKTLATQRLREEKLCRWVWAVPLATLLFAWGLPWVAAGFCGGEAKSGCCKKEEHSCGCGTKS